MMVAIAAPRTPSPSPKMKMGSRTMLSPAPMSMMIIAVLARPSERTMCVEAMAVARKGAPGRMTVRYSRA